VSLTPVLEYTAMMRTDPSLPPPYMGFWGWLDAALLALALVYAVVGALALRRTSRAAPGPA
jgi:hypothetical protein